MDEKFMKYKMIVTAALILAGCNKISPEDAIAYQSTELIRTAWLLYASTPSIPNGDITKSVIMAGGAHYKTPDITDVDSAANKRDREIMGRLSTDLNSNVIKNEFGGLVKILSKDGKLNVIYTNVPAHIDCSTIRNVTCEHVSS